MPESESSRRRRLTITLNRPDVLNASRRAARALAEALKEARDRPRSARSSSPAPDAGSASART